MKKKRKYKIHLTCPLQVGQLIMYYTPKKLLPFAFFFNLPGLQKPERIFSQTNLALVHLYTGTLVHWYTCTLVHWYTFTLVPLPATCFMHCTLYYLAYTLLASRCIRQRLHIPIAGMLYTLL